MSKREVLLLSLLGAVLIVFSVAFLPIFFSVVAITGLIWFALARGNGYSFSSYIALALGVILLLLIYPFDHTEGNAEKSAQQIALATGVIDKQKEVITERLGDEGNDAVFLIANQDAQEVVLARTSTESSKVYSIKDIDQEIKESKSKSGEVYQVKAYQPDDPASEQNKLMFSDFKETFPLKYGPAFIFFLLPLIFIASLPGRRKYNGKKAFDSREATLASWLLPAGPGDDARGSVGAAGTQIILVLALGMAIAFALSVPSIAYFF